MDILEAIRNSPDKRYISAKEAKERFVLVSSLADPEKAGVGFVDDDGRLSMMQAFDDDWERTYERRADGSVWMVTNPPGR